LERLTLAWFKKTKEPFPGGEGEAGEGKKIKIPEGMWVKCTHCREIIYRKEFERNLYVCPKCDYHFPISVEKRLQLLLDDGTLKEWDQEVYPLDPLNFRDSQRYRDRLKSTQDKTGFKDAIFMGEGSIQGRPVAFGVFHFGFMGGSMGSVVGERILRAAERAAHSRLPLIMVTASGGARMQEGTLSLMQMAKTAFAIGKLHEERVPFISILTDPTYGGVTASFAMLGDIIIAEPKAMIGFAGPRVIEQTIKQQLPAGFQRAEFLLEHGMLDMIVDRKRLKEVLTKLLGFF
jgi:acetyl-CoA carboxylase carboxyl transferase subunit beta